MAYADLPMYLRIPHYITLLKKEDKHSNTQEMFV